VLGQAQIAPGDSNVGPTPKNMVRSIRHWGLATGVLFEEPKSRGTVMNISRFGEFLFGDGESSGADPFLEDPNTLWLLHWLLISNWERSTTWQWAFNRFPSNEFTREGLLQSVEDEIRRLNLSPPSESTLKRDIEVFIRTYLSGRGNRTTAVEDSLDCPLTELNLLEEVSGTNLVKIRRGRRVRWVTAHSHSACCSFGIEQHPKRRVSLLVRLLTHKTALVRRSNSMKIA
jgi:hypothetical protein